MAWYRRSKLGFSLTSPSKIISPKPQTQNPVPIITHNTQSSKFTSTWNHPVTKLSSFSSLNVHRSSHFRYSGSGHRCYHVMRRFKRSKRPIISSLIVLVGLGIWVIICSGNVRYTILKRLYIMSAYVERVIGESQFLMMKAEFEWKVLPHMHPDGVRVRNILKHVIQEIQTKFNVALKKKNYKGMVSSYLERLNWEVLVIEDDAVYACFLPGGKFVVFTGLLKQFTTDDEIASVICHEAAHVVTRHISKRLVENFWLAFGRQVFYMIVRPNLDPREVFYMSDLPFSPRMEIEADYMGLLLMAIAGYDPRVAPKVYEKMGQVSAFHDYLTIHPMGNLRSKLLSEVGKANSINEEAIARREVDT